MSAFDPEMGEPKGLSGVPAASVRDGLWWMPPVELPLFQTAWWETASPEDRRAYARMETANSAAWIIQIELYLLRTLTRIASGGRNQDLDQIARESGEEWNHIRLFDQLINETGERPEVPSRFGRAILFVLGRRAVGSIFPTVVTFLAESYIYAVHEACIAADVTCDPRVTAVVVRHAREERGHLAFARRTLRAQWRTAGPLHRTWVRAAAPGIAAIMGHVVYTFPLARNESRWQIQKLVWRSDAHRRQVRQRYRPAVAFLTDVGVITRRSGALWRKLRLV